MQAYLKKHGPDHAGHMIKVEWSLSGRDISLKFTVTKRGKSSWCSDEKFSSEWKDNWGLWNTDVVESFLQLRKNPEDLKAPYLEVQVSPLNQPFALVIVEPRKTFHPPESLTYTHSVTLTDKVWETIINVTLPPEITGDVLYGSFFSCLGEGEREFYALEINPEENPDFHRPELFQKLEGI